MMQNLFGNDHYFHNFFWLLLNLAICDDAIICDISPPQYSTSGAVVLVAATTAVVNAAVVVIAVLPVSVPPTFLGTELTLTNLTRRHQSDVVSLKKVDESGEFLRDLEAFFLCKMWTREQFLDSLWDVDVNWSLELLRPPLMVYVPEDPLS